MPLDPQRYNRLRLNQLYADPRGGVIGHLGFTVTISSGGSKSNWGFTVASSSRCEVDSMHKHRGSALFTVWFTDVHGAVEPLGVSLPGTCCSWIPPPQVPPPIGF